MMRFLPGGQFARFALRQTHPQDGKDADSKLIVATMIYKARSTTFDA